MMFGWGEYGGLQGGMLTKYSIGGDRRIDGGSVPPAASRRRGYNML